MGSKGYNAPATCITNSKIDVLGAQSIAGHKDTITTLIYTELDAGHVADVHERAGVVKGIVAGRKTARKRLIG